MMAGGGEGGGVGGGGDGDGGVGSGGDGDGEGGGGGAVGRKPRAFCWHRARRVPESTEALGEQWSPASTIARWATVRSI